MVIIAMVSSLAKEAGGTSTAGSNRICSDERSREDEYSDGMPKSEGRVHSTQPICHGCGLGK